MCRCEAASVSCRIEHGDARHLDLPDQSVRLVVTSPPYFALRDYGEPDEIGTEPTPDEYVANLLEVLDELARVLTTDGNVFLVIGDKVARTGGVDRKTRGRGGLPGDPGGRSHARPVQRGVPGVPDGSLVGIPYRVALAAIDRGWLWRQDVVWAKPNPMPESVRRRAVRAHETVIHLSRTAQNYARPVERGGELGHDVWTVPVRGYHDPEGFRHAAVYPEELVARAVTDYSSPGDLVVDPFVGSGTTAVVAGRLGREFYGRDLSRDSVECARRRVSAARLDSQVAPAIPGQGSLFGEEGGLHAAGLVGGAAVCDDCAPSPADIMAELGDLDDGEAVLERAQWADPRLGELVEQVDQYADQHDISRAEAVRRLTERGLTADAVDREIQE